VLILDAVPGMGDYPAGVYATVAATEPRHWWYASRNDVITRVLAAVRRERDLSTLVEVGCGTGFVLSALEREGWDVLGLDMAIEGLRCARRRVDGPLIRTGRPELPLADPVDVVALFDVLEHTEEAPLLAAARAALAERGVLVLTVPARPSLWSLEDVMVGHRRRYTRASLAAALEAAGFSVLLNRPFHAVVTPLAWPSSRLAVPPPEQRPDPAEWALASIRPPRPVVGAALRTWLRLENRIGTWFPLPFGSALIALAEVRRS
jgi:SAM-dependent methyltransferase